MPGSHSSGSDSYPSPCCCFRMSPDRAPETRFAFLHKKLVNIFKAYYRTFSWKSGFKKPVSVTCSRHCGSGNLSAQVNASGQDSRRLSMYRRPTPVTLPGKSHGQRSLAGYSPWACKESDTTEHATPRTIRGWIFSPDVTIRKSCAFSESEFIIVLGTL